MAASPSPDTLVRITSARKHTDLRSYLERMDVTHPDGVPIQRRSFRESDPPSTTVADLSPNDLGFRVVIRSGEFLGTVYGTLLAVEPHPTLAAFTTVQLYGKKLLTFRNDTEALVVG